MSVKSIKSSFILDENKIKEYKEKMKISGKLEVPYNKSGSYFAICKALSNLGENDWHSLLELKDEMQNVMSKIPTSKIGIDAWTLFVSKANRNDSTGKDLIGKIIQNAQVLQRVIDFSSSKENNNPYGYKLQQLCYCIDMKKDNNVLYFRLNNQFSEEKEVKPLKVKN